MIVGLDEGVDEIDDWLRLLERGLNEGVLAAMASFRSAREFSGAGWVSVVNLEDTEEGTSLDELTGVRLDEPDTCVDRWAGTLLRVTWGDGVLEAAGVDTTDGRLVVRLMALGSTSLDPLEVCPLPAGSWTDLAMGPREGAPTALTTRPSFVRSSTSGRT